jgi:glutaredoxin 3
MSVTVYTTPTCGFCHQVKAYLNQRGVPFTEYDVSRDMRRAQEMVRVSGQQGVPVVVIDGQAVVGFNRPQIDRLLAQRAAQPPRLGAAVASAKSIAAKRGLSLPEGAYVGKVHGGSVAARAGLRKGDVILRLADQVVRDDADVRRILQAARPGKAMQVVVWRDGQTLQLRATF